MVGDAVVLEVVRADFLGPVAAADHAAPLRTDRFLLFRELHLIQPRPQDSHRLLFVLQLRLLVLDAHHQTGRLVGDADGGVGYVDALATGAGRSRSLDLDVVWLEFDLDRAGFGQLRTDRGRGE